MYLTCPKCAHRRDHGDPTPGGECPACGLVFAKWMKQRFRAVAPPPTEAEPARVRGLLAGLAQRLFHVEKRVSSVEFYGRVAVYLLLVGWGVALIRTAAASGCGGWAKACSTLRCT